MLLLKRLTYILNFNLNNMVTLYCILSLIAGVVVGSFIESPINVYNGSVRIKQKGRNNVQDNQIKAEISGSMTRREVIKLWKSLKK